MHVSALQISRWRLSNATLHVGYQCVCVYVWAHHPTSQRNNSSQQFQSAGDQAALRCSFLLWLPFCFFVNLPHPSIPVNVYSLVSCLRSSECSWKGRRGGTRRPRRKQQSAGPCTPSYCLSLTTASTRTSCSMTTSRRRSRWEQWWRAISDCQHLRPKKDVTLINWVYWRSKVLTPFHVIFFRIYIKSLQLSTLQIDTVDYMNTTCLM